MLTKDLLLACGGGDPLNGVIGPVYDYHGFKLQRHISDEATVITYKAADGSIKRIAVKDAKYRNVLKFGTYETDVPGLANITATGLNGMYIKGSGAISSRYEMPASVTNDLVFSQWSDALKTDKTARANCDIWMTYNNQMDNSPTPVRGVPAVAWCRAQTLAGKQCDLANEYELICIRVCDDKLDEIDPTSAAYPKLRLGRTATGIDGYGRCQRVDNTQTRYLYSSTEFGGTSVRTVDCEGLCTNLMKKNSGTAVPILELD